MKILILGAKGLLGEQLQKTFSDHEVIAYDREELDVTNFSLLKSEIENLNPEIVINCVAWNDVDGAEREEATTMNNGVNRAMILNCAVVRELAKKTKYLGIPLVTFSTDNVFGEGEHAEKDTPRPLNAYGRSKYCGERALQEETDLFYLIRTTRLYGPKPRSALAKSSFVLRMIELAKDKTELRVVDQEPGNFTYVKDLAERIRSLIEESRPYGIYHVVADGAVTWYECAREIFTYLGRHDVVVQPVLRKDFPRPAHTPEHGVFVNTKLPPLRDWKSALHEFLDEYIR